MGTEYDYTCPNCSKECIVGESLIGQTIKCPFCSKEFFATPPAPPLPPGTSSASSEAQSELTPPRKLPFFKSSRRKLLEAKVDELLAIGPIDDNIALELAAYAVSLKLEPSELTEIQQEKFAAEFDPIKKRIVAAMMLTDEDMAAEQALAKKYGIQPKLTGDADTFRSIYLVETKGQLPPPLATDLMLDAKECAYYSVPTTWHQPRVRKLGYSGASLSLPTGIKGVRYRFGSYAPINSGEEMTPLTSGSLYVTSKRLLFNGETRNTAISLTKIVDCQMYSDALKVEKSTGKPDLFSMGLPQARYILALIGALK
jgi:DNA-directed RNA polymerase subunit RPC12/RpoP